MIQVTPSQAIPGASILLVEDDRDVAAMYSFGLRCGGHQVVCAGDGGVAVDLASRQDFDLVLLDVQLPRVNGVEALAALRADPVTRDLPVVMFTNSADESIRLRANSLGITDWITKSHITPGELSRRVFSWLARPEAPNLEVANR